MGKVGRDKEGLYVYDGRCMGIWNGYCSTRPIAVEGLWRGRVRLVRQVLADEMWMCTHRGRMIREWGGEGLLVMMWRQGCVG